MTQGLLTCTSTCLPVLFSLMICSCVPNDTNTDLRGHWHVDLTSYGFRTLDIYDSLIVTDEYELNMGDRLELPRWNNLGHQILPSKNYRVIEKFRLSGDTLEIFDSTSVEKYIRSNLADCLIADRYRYVLLDISLAEVKEAKNLDISYSEYCSENLFIGKLKRSHHYFDSLLTVFPDSMFIQVNDLLISLNDIPLICKNVKDMCNDHRAMNINLHADKNVPQKFMTSLVQLIPDTINIHTAVRIKNVDVGLQKIR